MDEENVLDFLTSLEAMDLPDRIEEVNAKILTKIVEETDFVAVLFCKSLSLLLSISLNTLNLCSDRSNTTRRSHATIQSTLFSIVHQFISNGISSMLSHYKMSCKIILH